MTPEDVADPRLIERLQNLERRIERLEENLHLAGSGIPDQQQPAESDEERQDALEFKIGQFWFAKAGVVILALGLAFLMTLPYHGIQPLIPSVIGYLIVGAIIAGAHKWRGALGEISRHLDAAGLGLLYVITLRLHFFSEEPAIPSLGIEVIALCAAVVVSFFIALRLRSSLMIGMSAAMGYLTALISNDALFLFSAVALLSAAMVFLGWSRGRGPLALYGIVLSYLTHFLWALNNPVAGNSIKLVSGGPEYNLYFLLLYALIVALGWLLRAGSEEENGTMSTAMFLNIAGSYGLFLLLSVSRFHDGLMVNNGIASVVFLGLAIAFWLREKSKYSTFLYAMTGYAALSVAIIGAIDKPMYFVWLGWQSVLVISTAVWFRSRFIIIANFFIYLMVFAAYVVVAGGVTGISFNFGIIALVSARILNWRKDRLELKTEMMRNAYLASAFFIFPYSLYRLVPEVYVSISWLGVALFYFLMSIAVKSKKYRWMALLTLVVTILYVIAVDLTKLEPMYRIISFIVVGIVLLTVSLVYTRKRLAGSGKQH